MPRQTEIYQLDLFAARNAVEVAQRPLWHALPVETRQALTQLMVRLILDHPASRCAPEQGRMQRDV